MYDQIIKHLKDNLMISYDKDLIIDPHANNDTFIEGLQSLVKMSLFYNKNPVDENVLPLDFLQIDFDRFNKTFLAGLWFDDVHVISQPPPEQAEQFIEAACKFAGSVSFIMPKAAQYAFPSNYRRLFSTSITGTSITGTSITGTSITGTQKKEKELFFQIWLRADY
jgi:hypothetical protein